jgi:chloramphenicol 3-O-phosphotransferase
MGEGDQVRGDQGGLADATVIARVIILNGVGSVGKSSTAKALQAVFRL